MFRIDVESKGWDKVLAKLGLVELVIEGDLTIEDLKILGSRTLELAKESISTPYPPASLPGEAPHRRTSDLMEGLEFEVNEEELKVTIRSTIGYGIFLELGTSKMQARPFLIPAFFIALEEFRRDYAEKLKKRIEAHE